MILQSNYTDSSKKLIRSFDEEMNRKNAELETAQAELADADAALEILGVTVDA